jgi:hypothetical protein
MAGELSSGHTLRRNLVDELARRAIRTKHPRAVSTCDLGEMIVPGLEVVDELFLGLTFVDFRSSERLARTAGRDFDRFDRRAAPEAELYRDEHENARNSTTYHPNS